MSLPTRIGFALALASNLAGQALLVEGGFAVRLASAGPSRAYAGHAFLAHSQTREVKESSGVAPSHFDPEVFWTHNDSGRHPRVYAFRLSETDRRERLAVDLGCVELGGARCVDWEDMAAGPDESLYVFDGGDNPPCKRKDKRILRFREPKVDWRQAPIRRTVRCESARFDYPDRARPGAPASKSEDRYDAECLLVHPNTGDIYVITKRDSANKVAARLYRLPAASIQFDGRTVHVLEFVANLSSQAPGLGAGGLAGMVTGGAVAPDGARVVVRTYLAAYEFTLPAGRAFETVFDGKPRVISLVGEPQGEAICYARNGDLITTAEAAAFGPQFPIFITPVISRPATSVAP